MKLTIIVEDGAVYRNGICFSGLSWGGTPENVRALQWNAAAGWIEFNDGTPNEAIDALPVWAQNALAAWELADVENTPAPPTFEDLKQAKREAVNARRDELETSGFLFNGVLFDSDQRSANRILFAALAAQSAIATGTPYAVDWAAADNSVVTLDAYGVVGMAVALAQSGAVNFYAAKDLKAEIDAAETQEQLDAIIIP